MVSLIAITSWVLSASVAQESTIVTATSSSIAARDITLIEEKGELVLKYTDNAGHSQSIKASDVVELTMGKASLASKAAPEDLEMTLTTGDQLIGKAAALAENAIKLVNPIYKDPQVEFSQIRRVILPQNAPYLPKDLPAKADREDIIFLKNGDRGTGSLVSLSTEGLTYYSTVREKNVTLPLGEVAGVWLIEQAKPPQEPDRPFAAIMTSDGSSMRGEIKSLVDGVLSFTDLFGRAHKIASNKVTGIYMKNGRVVYLSDLRPTAVSEDANYIRGPAKSPSDLEFPWQADRSARGTKILLGGTEHRKGLGVRAYCALTYPLGGSFKRLQATFGLDAVSRGLGSVLGEVWVDGKKLKEISLKGSDPPQAFDIDLAGGKELKLVVTWGGNGQSDFADWGSARLVR